MVQVEPKGISKMTAKGQVGTKAWPVQTEERGSHTGSGECHRTPLQPGMPRRDHTQGGNRTLWVTDGAISVEMCAK